MEAVGKSMESVGNMYANFHAEFESISGVGLGLAIVDDCVSAIDGTVTVESEVGVGTILVLALAAGSCRPAETVERGDLERAWPSLGTRVR